MSKINDMLIQAEEDQNNEERLAKWRAEWAKCLRLQEEWNLVYHNIKQAERKSWELPQDED